MKTKSAAWDAQPVRFRTGTVNHLIITNVIPELYGPLRYSLSDFDRPDRRGGPDPDNPVCGQQATSTMTGPDNRLPLCRTCEAWVELLDRVLADAREDAAQRTLAYQEWQRRIWDEEQRLMRQTVYELPF